MEFTCTSKTFKAVIVCNSYFTPLENNFQLLVLKMSIYFLFSVAGEDVIVLFKNGEGEKGEVSQVRHLCYCFIHLCTVLPFLLRCGENLHLHIFWFWLQPGDDLVIICDGTTFPLTSLVLSIRNIALHRLSLFRLKTCPWVIFSMFGFGCSCMCFDFLKELKIAEEMY